MNAKILLISGLFALSLFFPSKATSAAFGGLSVEDPGIKVTIIDKNNQPSIAKQDYTDINTIGWFFTGGMFLTLFAIARRQNTLPFVDSPTFGG